MTLAERANPALSSACWTGLRPPPERRRRAPGSGRWRLARLDSATLSRTRLVIAGLTWLALAASFGCARGVFASGCARTVASRATGYRAGPRLPRGSRVLTITEPVTPWRGGPALRGDAVRDGGTRRAAARMTRRGAQLTEAPCRRARRQHKRPPGAYPATPGRDDAIWRVLHHVGATRASTWRRRASGGGASDPGRASDPGVCERPGTWERARTWKTQQTSRRAAPPAT